MDQNFYCTLADQGVMNVQRISEISRKQIFDLSHLSAPIACVCDLVVTTCLHIYSRVQINNTNRYA
jgi:hypothetical protein